MLASINGLFRLTRDAEVTVTEGGMSIVKLGLVCSEKYKEKETVLFIDGTAFGKAGEIINQYAGKKGTQIYLRGKLQTDQWEKDGEKKSKISMVVEGFDFVSDGRKKDSHGDSGEPEVKHENVPADGQQQMDIDDDEVPF